MVPAEELDQARYERGARRRGPERRALPAQIVEAIIRAAVYCGFPRALNAVFAAQRVFAERDLLPVR
jgi:hypothetical protein